MFAKPAHYIEHQIAYSPVWIPGGVTAYSYGPGWEMVPGMDWELGVAMEGP